MLGFTCSVCNSSEVAQMLACSHGCGAMMHLKCFPTHPTIMGSVSCDSCKSKAPGGAQANVLKRIADLTNLVLSQYQEISELRRDLGEVREELTTCKNKLNVLEGGLRTNRSEGPGLFEFGARAVPASRGPNNKPASVPSIESTLSTKQRSISYLGVLKRKRLDDLPSKRTEVIVGSASANDCIVPVVKRVVTKRVFVSRVAPSFSSEDLYKAVKPKMQSSLSVSKLHTAYPHYASFCLSVDSEADEKTLLAHTFWTSGTIIKPFFGRLVPEKVHSRFGDSIDMPPSGSPVVADPNSDTASPPMES